MTPHPHAMTAAETAAHLNTPPAPPDPALVADVRRFFAAYPRDARRDCRLDAWRDDATASTAAAVADMLRGITGGMAQNLIERVHPSSQ